MKIIAGERGDDVFVVEHDDAYYNVFMPGADHDEGDGEIVEAEVWLETVEGTFPVKNEMREKILKFISTHSVDIFYALPASKLIN